MSLTCTSSTLFNTSVSPKQSGRHSTINELTLSVGILTQEINEFVKQTKLGFVATVCPDGTPNLSPKGTTTVWDDDHLVFADIHSPGTITNLLVNPSIEINIVDVFIRKGFRFKGTGEILSEGKLFEEIISFYKEAGSKLTINHILLVKVELIIPILSPIYDTDISEEQVIKRWSDYWAVFYKRK